jgi:ElaB/YqjD/DUF883 family membrane-anchored ribosome-binding protein
MNNISESFPQTRQDISNLKKTAVAAARDIRGTATERAKVAQEHLQNLASHAQEESSDQLNQVRVSLGDLANDLRDYVAARPFETIGIALAVGFFTGVFRRSRRFKSN